MSGEGTNTGEDRAPRAEATVVALSGTSHLSRWCVLAIVIALTQPVTPAWDVTSTIDPAITANPIEVVVWVMDGVDSVDEARVLDQIQQGLDLWADVPTSEIDFQIVNVIHSSTNPGKLQHQMQIIVGNAADLTGGGAATPSDGYPGSWLGAIADAPTANLVPVTAHEIGHAMGFLHSTLSVHYPEPDRPIMHFANGGMNALRTDDVAAISSIYPNTGGPNLLDVGGAIRGRVVSQLTGLPITGVNVVAVDQSSGTPAIARVSGAGGTAGEFDLVGLPPGTYEVHFLDGHSYRGSVIGLGSGFNLGGPFQADNFSPFNSSAIAVAAGNDFDIGDVDLTVLPLSLSGMHVGPIGEFEFTIDLDPLPVDLPAAVVGQPYEVWLHVVGGVRDLSATVAGLVPGLSAAATYDPRSPNLGIRGSRYLRVHGTPEAAGSFTVDVQIDDDQGTTEMFSFGIATTWDCAGDLDNDGTLDCSDACIDEDDDGYGYGGGAGDTCAGADCLDQDPSIYWGAPEINDGQDNQCPGDEGFGQVDETSGVSGFHDPGDKDLYAWSPQGGALTYEVLRSGVADFSSGCALLITRDASWLDPNKPEPGAVFFYLNRALNPIPGSWGHSTSGERVNLCPLPMPLASWEFNGPATAVSTVDPNLSASSIQLGPLSPGAILFSLAGNPAPSFAGRGLEGVTPAWTAAPVPDPDQYFELTIAPVGGSSMTLTGFGFDESDNGFAPRAWSVRSSLDGFSADLQTGGITLTNSPFFRRHGFPLGAAFQGLAFPVTFRLYGFDATQPPAGAFLNDFHIDNVVIHGTSDQEPVEKRWLSIRSFAMESMPACAGRACRGAFGDDRSAPGVRP